MRSSIGVLIAGFSLAACSAQAVVGREETVPIGYWGTDQVALQILADRADLEFECADGRINGPFRIDGNGDFDLPGTFTAQGPGPSRDEDSSVSKVRYRGNVRGDTMTLTVIHGERRIGPYALTKDLRPILRKCR